MSDERPDARPGERSEQSERGQQRRRSASTLARAAAAAAPARGPQKRAALGPLPILLGIFAGLALCALVYFALTLFARQAPNSPTAPPALAPTAQAICGDLAGQRYDQLYTLLSPSLQAQGAETQFAASQRELDRLLGPVRGCQPSLPSAQPSGGAAQMTLRLQRGQAAATNAAITLVQSGNAWRVSGYSQTV